MHRLTKRVGACLSMGAALGASILLGAAANPKVERGKYLVERACMCADCHTPMTPKGEPDPTKWLHGANLMFNPKIPIPDWVDQSPTLAGLVGYTDAQVLQILQNGLKDGKPLRPPMPRFRFNREDAEAIVAYLRSLKPPAKPAGRR